MEKYLQVKWGDNMVFRDSLQFLPVSLEQLVASLTKTGRENFINLHSGCKFVLTATFCCLQGNECFSMTTSTHLNSSRNQRLFFEKRYTTSCRAKCA